jgi:NAD-dependent DNA ligase
MQFFSEFLERPGHRAVEQRESPESALITGICAACPDIEIRDRLFCFTGRSQKCSRQELACRIERCGGRFSKAVARDVDYLVVGADGNPCWAYACYGRKVETAIKYRKQGFRILLVHEYDFWDAVEDGM